MKYELLTGVRRAVDIKLPEKIEKLRKKFLTFRPPSELDAPTTLSSTPVTRKMTRSWSVYLRKVMD